ncbi:hypothetical protein SLA2020_034100 [Shorea laevis]
MTRNGESRTVVKYIEHCGCPMPVSDGLSESMVDVVDEAYNRDGSIADSSRRALVGSALESSSHVHGLNEEEEENQGSMASKSSKKKNATRKRKGQMESDILFLDAQESLQQMGNLGSDGIPLNGYYGAQPNVHGLVQLNLMEPPHDGFYVNQQSMQGLGQLNSMAPSNDSFFGTQQNLHGLGQLDYRHSTGFNYPLQDEAHLRSTQLHGSSSRHP